MTKKSKDIVWHKKIGKIIPSSMAKAHHVKDEGAALQENQNRQQKFAKNLSEKIKRAVKKS